MNRIVERRFIPDFKNGLECSSEIGPILAEHRSLDADLRLPQWGFTVSTEVVIKAPPKDATAYARYLRVKMRIDDLGKDRIRLRDFEGVRDHVALRISQPCRRFIPLKHEYAFFRPRWPNVLLFYARIEC